MIVPHAEGCVVSVRAQPGARKRGFVGVHGDAVKLAVPAPAVDGKANEAFIELLADLLGVKRGHIELIGGQTSRDKRFLVRGVTAEAARTKLGLLPL